MPSPLPWLVITTRGQIELYAANRQHAILSALELLGPDAELIRAGLVEDWRSS